MAVETITTAQFHEHARQWEHTALTTELLLALGAVVLSILGIVGVFPTYLAAIAVIAIGAILLFQSASVVLQYTELLYEAGATNKVDVSHVSRGITAEVLAGMAGIVLGVLALLGIAQMTLLSVAVIAYGGTLLLTSGELVWLNSFDAKENEMVRQLMHSMSLAAAGAQVLVGLAARERCRTARGCYFGTNRVVGEELLIGYDEMDDLNEIADGRLMKHPKCL